MIIQSASQAARRYFAIAMDDHTDLAGQFARAFGNGEFEPVEPRDLMLYVISYHDKGWAAYDSSPKTDSKTGLPYNLVDTPAEDITKTSAASPDFNEKHHPYCGLLSSMHSWGLYNGRYGMSEIVLIDTIAPKDRHLADRMLEGELKRQEALKRKLKDDPKTASLVADDRLFQNYKQLQFFDTLALYFNRAPEGARKEMRFPHVPRDKQKDVTITITPRGDGVYALSPYPFASNPGQFSFAGRYVEPSRDKDQDWRQVLSTTPVERQRFTLISG